MQGECGLLDEGADRIEELEAALRLVEKNYGEDSDVFCLVRAALEQGETE